LPGAKILIIFNYANLFCHFFDWQGVNRNNCTADGFFSEKKLSAMIRNTNKVLPLHPVFKW
jgi:hypothetical protein